MMTIYNKEQDVRQQVAKLSKRHLGGITKEQERAMRQMLDEIRKSGDKALIKYVAKYDGLKVKKVEELIVTQNEITAAYDQVEKDFFPALNHARRNIEAFQRQMLQSRTFRQEEKIPVKIRDCWFWERDKGIILGQKFSSLESVGVYVPGGKASYPSTVLMTVVPAQVAGVKRIALASPPKKKMVDPHVLVTAHQLGVQEIYKMGGAQAIGAMALGTATIPKVDKVVGPGSPYVNFGKQNIFGYCDVDMLAGPTEIVVIADRSATPAYIAADVVSQAEHSPDTILVIITLSDSIARRTLSAIKQALRKAKRKEIIERALKNGKILVVKNLEDAIEISNQIAPEHLCLQVKPYWQALEQVKNAGAIFLGNYAAVAAGDYLAGPSHVLPTGGTARFFSPLSVFDFIKSSSIIFYTREELLAAREELRKFAQVEGLLAHATSVEARV